MVLPQSPGQSPKKTLGLITSLTAKLHLPEDAVVCTKERMNWDSLKRTPQLLKQKVNLGSYTIDEDFDNLKDKLEVAERNLKALSKHIHSFKEQLFQNIEIATTIAETLTQLYDPLLSLPKALKADLNERMKFSKGKDYLSSLDGAEITESQKQAFLIECKIWKAIGVYKSSIDEILPAIKPELALLEEIINKKVNEVFKLFGFINKHIQKREYVKLDYDKAYNNHESLLYKQKQNDLSFKQSQQIYSLARKMDQYKQEYDRLNDFLKEELSFFFSFLDAFLEPIQTMIYFVQLMVIYQFSLNLNTLHGIFDSTPDELGKKDFIDVLLCEFYEKNEKALNSIEDLFIVKFRKQYFQNLTSSLATTSSIKEDKVYCTIKFSFNGQEPGDLTVRAGDTVRLIDYAGEWWKGELNGETGIFPGNYVVKEDYEFFVKKSMN